MKKCFSCLLKKTSLYLFIIFTANVCNAATTDILSSIELSKHGAITIALQRQARCMFGDLNAIKLEIAHSPPSTDLLLSIESLTDKNKPPYAKYKIEIRDVLVTLSGQGILRFPVPLEVPAESRADLVGIYICKDSRASGACRNKQILDINAVLFGYDPTEPSYSKTKSVSDKTYFFKPALLQKDQLHFVERRMTDELYREFNALTHAKLGNGIDVVNALKDSKLTGSTLLSSPIKKLSDTSLTIVLPEIDIRKCGGK